MDVGLDTPLPHSLDAERSILGAILVDNGALHATLPRVRARDFYRDAHRRVYEAMIRLSERGSAIDLVTLKDELSRAGDLEPVGGAAGLAGLTDGVPRAANIEHYAGIVRGKAVLRELIQTSHRVIQTAAADEEEPTAILDTAEKAIFSIAEDQYRGGFVSAEEMAHQSLEHLQLLRREGRLTGLITGFPELNRLTTGLQAGDLVLIAARPGMGKTAFALNIAQFAALREGKSVGMFSLEMGREQLFIRLLSSLARVELYRLRSGTIDNAHWRALNTAAAELAQTRLFIDDTAGITVLEMRAKARRLAAEHGLDMLIVDYLQLMRGRGRYENRNLEVADISRSLKELAKELRIPVLALSQLSRSPEQRGRTDRRPQLSDLRESGALEQDADLVLFLYRPSLYNQDDPDPTFRLQAELIIGKQRNGPTGTIPLYFVGEYVRFENPDDHHTDVPV